MKASIQTTLLLTIGTFAGCAIPSPQPATVVDLPAGLENVRVCLLVDPRWQGTENWGTGVPIGDGVIATCLHVVRAPISSLSIDDQSVPIEVIAAEGAWHWDTAEEAFAHKDDWTDVSRDWLKFRVTNKAKSADFQPSPGTAIDFDRPVRFNEPIYLIGFTGENRESLNLTKPTIFAGHVAKKPQHWHDRVIAVAVNPPPDHDHYGGMSGGAAAVHDKETNQWVVVGLFRGGRERRMRLGPLEWTEWNLMQVVRPPVQP